MFNSIHEEMLHSRFTVSILAAIDDIMLLIGDSLFEI